MEKEKKLTQKQEKYFTMIMGVLLLISSFLLAKETAEYVNGTVLQKENRCIVIDPGHGGIDPGKIGINGVLEKDINLEIAMLLKDFLEASDVKVILTRTGDYGLYNEDSQNKKTEDLKNRLRIIEEKLPSATISIHQNSYEQEGVHGAQVFYYEDSKQGEKLANLIQNAMIKTTDPHSERKIKGNKSYYLLTKTKTPMVIVECGFLSNYKEAEKLSEPEYQEKIAWAIHLGILQYLNQNNG